jgi:uncharacterized membrane protein
VAAIEVPQQPQSQSKPDPLRHYAHYTEGDDGSSPYAGGSSFMERLSEGVASGMGTVGFLLISSGVIIAWVLAARARPRFDA